MFKKFKSPPEAETMPLYESMLTQTHVLIAGTTGSGKSVVLNGVMHQLLQRSPKAVDIIIIDPKRIDFIKYKKLPHVLKYANTPEKAKEALSIAVNIMESRFRYCERKKTDKYPGIPVYIIVDEFADLLTVKGIKDDIVKLGRLARAANIHLLIATQNPSRKVICAEIQANFPSQLALRCRTAIESKQVIGQSGAELLPMHGKAYYYTPDEGRILYVDVPMVPESELKKIIKYWR